MTDTEYTTLQHWVLQARDEHERAVTWRDIAIVLALALLGAFAIILALALGAK